VACLGWPLHLHLLDERQTRILVDLGRIELPSRTPYRTFIQRYTNDGIEFAPREWGLKGSCHNLGVEP